LRLRLSPVSISLPSMLICKSFTSKKLINITVFYKLNISIVRAGRLSFIYEEFCLAGSG
jgi:hypothetical protein